MPFTPIRFSFFAWLLVCVVVASGCQQGLFAKKSPTDTQFEEDLSAYRPRFEAPKTVVPENAAEKPTSSVKPTSDITQKLESALDTIAVRNKNIRYAQGYRIQIYSGGERDEANRARDRSYALFPDITPHFVYLQPTFRVKVGDFIDRLEAQRVYAGLLSEFPNALIIQDRVEIR